MTDRCASCLALEARCAALTQQRDQARKSYDTMSEACKFNVQKRGELEHALIDADASLRSIRAAVEQQIEQWYEDAVASDGYEGPEIRAAKDALERCADELKTALSTLVQEQEPSNG